MELTKKTNQGRDWKSNDIVPLRAPIKSLQTVRNIFYPKRETTYLKAKTAYETIMSREILLGLCFNQQPKSCFSLECSDFWYFWKHYETNGFNGPWSYEAETSKKCINNKMQQILKTLFFDNTEFFYVNAAGFLRIKTLHPTAQGWKSNWASYLN